MDDEQILDLYFARDPQAVACTQERYGRKLQALARNILKNQEDAEESENDTYFQTWQTVPPQRPGFFYGYLAKICRNFAFGRLDWQNAAKRKAEVVFLSQEMEQCIPDRLREAELEGREIARAVSRFLQELPAENRVLFVRRYWHCESVRALARRYGMGESQVKMRLKRTRERLARYLEQEGIFL